MDTHPKMSSQWRKSDGGWQQITGPEAAPADTALQLTLDSGKTLVIPARGH
jgi:hypothetical protein